MVDVLSRLTAPDVEERLVRLRFRDDDRADVLQAAATVATSPEHLDCVARLAQGLLGVVGCIERPFASDPFSPAPKQSGELGVGVLPMLALLVTVDEVQQFHSSLGISEQLS